MSRVFVLKMVDVEDLIASVQRFVKEKDASSGIILSIRALKYGRVVTGPESPVIPPTPHFEAFESA